MDQDSRRELFEISSGLRGLIWECQWSNYSFLRGLASLLCCPLFCIQTIFSGGLAEILQTVSYKVVRTTTSETISIFPLIQLNSICRMNDISDSLICSTNPAPGFWVLFFPSWVYTQVLFSSNAFYYGGLSSEGTIALQLPRGKQIFQCLWLGNIQSSSCVGLWEQGISGFSLSFQLLGCKEQVGIASRVFAITLWASMCQYSGFRPLWKWSHFIPSTCSCWILPGYSNWSIWTCCDSALWTWPHFPWNLAWGNRAPY